MEKFWLSCSRCSKVQPFELKGKCSCGGTLLVDYDLEYLRRTWSSAQLLARPWNMWRYRELLPVKDERCIVSLGEGGTPLLSMASAERRYGMKAILSKREELNPTGSFKARGFSSAVTLLQERGIRKAAVNSNGNAASALAAYAARAGLEAYVFVPKDCPGLIVEECLHYGAYTYLVDGLIQDAGRIVETGLREQNWAHVGTMREPGRAEGKKTMGLEIAEQLGWKLPDVIIYPTGGGSGIIGIWRAFEQLQQLGWVHGDMPRLIAVQERGCQPIVRLLHEGAGKSVETVVSSTPTGLRVPNPPDSELIISILKKTGGDAIAVTSDDMREAARELAAMGMSASPEGASTWAGFMQLRDRQAIRPSERVILFNTSHAAKYWPWTPSLPLPVIKSYEDFQAVNLNRKQGD